MNPLKIFTRNSQLKKSLGELRPRIYRAAYAWSHDPSLADELTQEALTKALRKLDQVRNPETLDRWLFGILANCWRDHFRRLRPMEDIEDCPLCDDNSPDKQHEQQRLVGTVRRAIGKLPEGQRQTLTLVDLEGFSYAEVSDILQIPIGTVMSRLCRARKALAGHLIEYKSQPTEEVGRIRRIS